MVFCMTETNRIRNMPEIPMVAPTLNSLYDRPARCTVDFLALFWKSTVHLAGRSYKLFNVGATIGISGMFLILLVSVIQNTIRLYRREPLPESSSPSGQQKPEAERRRGGPGDLRSIFGANNR